VQGIKIIPASDNNAHYEMLSKVPVERHVLDASTSGVVVGRELRQNAGLHDNLIKTLGNPKRP
jgi:hypothetical protein